MVKNKKDLFIASLIQFRAFDIAVTLKHNVIFEHNYKIVHNLQKEDCLQPMHAKSDQINPPYLPHLSLEFEIALHVQTTIS